MSAREELFDRLKHLESAIKLTSLIDEGIALSTHNGVANLLRKGLGIVAFNILEDYVKNRSYEALDHLSKSSVRFEKLTDELQSAALSNALSGLLQKSKSLKRDRGNWKELIQDETLIIHSTKNDHYKLSNLSFFSTTSNISAQDVSDLLKAFGIDGGWSRMKSTSDAFGGGVLDLCQSYNNAAARRHSAAHGANFRYEYQWLLDIKDEILAICASLDVLLEARCRQISNDLGKRINDHSIERALKFRFLEKYEGKYRETLKVGGKARKLWPSDTSAIVSLSPKLARNDEFLFILDESKRVLHWRT